MDVPAQETTYTCMLTEAPQDRDYHLVAMQPIIINADVMHHIIVYGCNPVANVSRPLDVPFNCLMNADPACTDIIGIWAVGSNGICHHPAAGFRIGLNGYRTIAIETHWNNPELRADYKDSSGVSLHLSPQLRPFDAGTMMIGQQHLEIPPGESSYATSGSCSSTCTGTYFKGPINVTAVVNHMHYLGVQQHTEVFDWEGRKKTDLAFDEVYSYDSPVLHEYADPIVVLPGDEIRTKCVFKTTSRSTTTYFGESTSEEMCYAFLTYYPKQDVATKSCISWRSVSQCDFDSPVIQGCSYRNIEQELAYTFQDVDENCSTGGTCRQECKAAVQAAKRHPCIAGDYGHALRDYANENFEMMKFFRQLDSCNYEMAKEMNCP